MRHILTSVFLLILLYPSNEGGVRADEGAPADVGAIALGKDVRVRYYDNGQLHYKGTFKNGKWDGPWVFYQKNGQFNSSIKLTDFLNGTGIFIGVMNTPMQ